MHELTRDGLSGRVFLSIIEGLERSYEENGEEITRVEILDVRQRSVLPWLQSSRQGASTTDHKQPILNAIATRSIDVSVIWQ